MAKKSRKLEHIKYFLSLAENTAGNGFSDVQLLHDCLPETSLQAISLSTRLGRMRLSQPIIIDAITGGDEKLTTINRDLAAVAKATGCAMAVGSQHAALKDRRVRPSYEIVRKINPDGLIFANIGAYANAVMAKEAVDMLGAQALEIHLNVAQELFMTEGDRAFDGYIDNIAEITQALTVPVIVKETGCGVSMETVGRLLAAGVRIINVAGTGGSNFLAIETMRAGKSLDADITGWGINTALSTLEAARIGGDKTDIIVSGGIKTSLDIIKALACGGRAVGIAGLFLGILLKQGRQALEEKIKQLLAECQRLLLLTGSSDIDQLHKKPLIITGFAQQWLTARGIDPASFAGR